MSFVRVLATLATGFAAAKGYDKFRQMGGLAGVREKLGQADIGGQMSDMAQKMGVPAETVAKTNEMLGALGEKAAEAGKVAQAGLGTAFETMQGLWATGSKSMADMMSQLTAGTAAGAVMEEQARLMIQAMIQAAKADGEIDAAERAKILDQLGDASPEEVAFVQAELDKPSDLTAFASVAGTSAAAQVYATALTAITPDTVAENGWLESLATTLKLDREARNRVHAGMGLPPVA